MGRRLQKVTTTRKRFTVVLGCYDPHQPVVYLNTNRAAQALQLFNEIKRLEITTANGKDHSGESWSLRLYRHMPESRARSYVTAGEDGYVYDVRYERSIVLEEFTGHDLRQWHRELF